jgi:ankyrin repeat protein
LIQVKSSHQLLFFFADYSIGENPSDHRHHFDRFISLIMIQGETVLHLAAKKGLCKLIERLLRGGAGGNPNLQTLYHDDDDDESGGGGGLETALHLAVSRGNKHAIDALLQHGSKQTCNCATK